MNSIAFWVVLPSFLASAAALGLAAILLAKNRVSPFHRSVAVALGAVGVIQLANGFGVSDVTYTREWRRLGLVFELLFPATLQYVVLVFLKAKTRGEESGARWRAHAVTALAVALAMSAVFGLIDIPAMSEDGPLATTPGAMSRVAYVFILLSLTLGLALLEHILRVSRDPMRYEIKYVLIGLGGLAGYEIYQASQLIMLPLWNLNFVLVSALASLISLGLLMFGLGRLRLRQVRAKIYISPQVLYGSVTFLVIGIYLLVVGVIGEVIRHTGEPLSVGLSVVVVFTAILGLVVVLFSRAARAAMRQFIARHFYRSKYDYRAKWLEVTQAFAHCVSGEEILDRLLEILGRTFGASRLSIWILYAADGQYHRVRSVNTEPAPPALDETHSVVLRLMQSDEPVEVEALDLGDHRTSAAPSAKLSDVFLCVPIRSERQLLGFITLSRQQGARYGQDDFDLLRAIAHHAGMLLSLANMAEDRRAAGELEALHRFSAFCLHDLKNLAQKLSLVVQNAQVHGQEPAFQQSVMRTVSGTVQKMTGLITKLSVRSAPSGVPESVDVPNLIAETISSMNGELRVVVNSTGRAAAVRIVKDQLQQVLLNVVLNAQQADAGRQTENPNICIDTDERDGTVIITVTDQGPGIPPEKLQTLFQPFQSTKSSGLGLGLYQCKRIIEEHGGSIRVQSEVGRGTEVRIELPAATRKPS